MTRFMARRFWSKVNKTCWLWTASKKSNGYGEYWDKGKLHRAHKFLWEKLNGPVPTGLQLDHLCRVRSCVNPKHLEAVTSRVNLLRGEGITAQRAFNAGWNARPQSGPRKGGVRMPRKISRTTAVLNFIRMLDHYPQSSEGWFKCVDGARNLLREMDKPRPQSGPGKGG